MIAQVRWGSRTLTARSSRKWCASFDLPKGAELQVTRRWGGQYSATIDAPTYCVELIGTADTPQQAVDLLSERLTEVLQ